MTYRSESRGFMYTAPPGPDDEIENRPTDAEAADETETIEATETTASAATPADEEATANDPSPTLDPTTAATDANWTGNVATDD